MKVECTFKLVNVTKGALRYEQTQENGQPVQPRDTNGQLVGTLYVRKAKMEGQPEMLKITVEY